ncbi:hypothetical protein ENH_00011050 [Eimeria necatrix]|uniref:Uncharacterized protein n=1 Tax=Eimeria necatrix TaxID=51315 RepID=U6MP88_9EIME|nr:hypothetical protein ENH_00011050 [Eimeria necatrix]CDJ65831.1 hypothetical protein ENH_00011050 [Eimeria necatrix]
MGVLPKKAAEPGAKAAVEAGLKPGEGELAAIRRLPRLRFSHGHVVPNVVSAGDQVAEKDAGVGSGATSFSWFGFF